MCTQDVPSSLNTQTRWWEYTNERSATIDRRVFTPSSFFPPLSVAYRDVSSHPPSISSLYKRISRINALHDGGHVPLAECERQWSQRLRHVAVSPTPSATTTRAKRAACKSDRNWDIIAKRRDSRLISAVSRRGHAHVRPPRAACSLGEFVICCILRVD